jgi:hypothetical protein
VSALRIVKQTAVYKYRNEKDRLLFERVRYATDQPFPRNKVVTYRYGIGGDWATGHGVGNGVMISEKHPDADRYLYRLPQFLAAPEGSDIWWTEGESDADALWLYDEVATSHHGGAGRATVSQAEWFRGFGGQVVLPYDQDPDDKRGGNVGALDVIRRYDLLRAVGLAAEQLVVVAPLVGKDMRDHLDAGHDPDEVIVVRDIQLLRDKATRTMGTSFGRAGYAPPDTELAELIDGNPAWDCQVLRGGVDGQQ